MANQQSGVLNAASCFLQTNGAVSAVMTCFEWGPRRCDYKYKRTCRLTTHTREDTVTPLLTECPATLCNISSLTGSGHYDARPPTHSSYTLHHRLAPGYIYIGVRHIKHGFICMKSCAWVILLTLCS